MGCLPDSCCLIASPARAAAVILGRRLAPNRAAALLRPLLHHMRAAILRSSSPTASGRKMADDLDNLRDGMSRSDRRYARMSIFAILEVEHDGVRWHPHWHILLAHPRIDRQEVAAVFRQRFPGARRVQVQPFHPKNPVSENVENCVGYASKFDHRDWSEYASSRLFLWIRQGAALRSMCSVLRARVKTYSPLDALSRSNSNSPSNTFVEPRPVVI